MRARLVAALLVSLALVGGRAGSEGIQREPVYVGAQVCGSCHEGPEMGHQYSHWLLSKHSRAYADLGTEAAREMALISGVTVDPREAPACLGCHATAFDAEGWELDPTFRIEDGVQCERCHGPGSEYMAEEVMRDPEAARAAGLTILSKRECDLCHYPKDSHVAVHGKPPLDLDDARRRLAHPTPPDAAPGTIPALPIPVDASGPKHVGVRVCVECHQDAEMGYQASLWRRGPHSLAYAVLATPAAREIARTQGLDGDPQQSVECLTCHTIRPDVEGAGFAPGWSVSDGVGCESCHGAGADYAPATGDHAGTEPVTPETCLACHDGGHGKPFDVDAAMRRIEHPTQAPQRVGGPRYKTPVNLAVTPDGTQIYVACEASSSVVVVDVHERRAIGEIAVGGQPHDVAFSPDGTTAFVSNRLDDSVSVIDVATRDVRRTLTVGDEPHGVLTDRAGRWLYVLNTAEDNISVFDTSSWEEVKRLSASRNPWSIALSQDGERILVTNNLSRFVPFRTSPMSEVTVIDAGRGVVEDRVVVDGANLIQGVSWHPRGDFALFTLNRTKNLVPMTRIVQGWTITNGIGILWNDGRVDQVLLDEPNRHFPDAADVELTPDGRYALVSSSGSDRVAVIDVSALISMLEDATPRERERVLPNHVGKSAEFVVKDIPTLDSPRGIEITPDGRTAFVANALDDSLTVIDMERLEAVGRVDLGGPEEITQARWGERLFHSADIAFQQQFSCHSCHPDGHVDGITYDIEPDGIGLDPVDNRTLRGIYDTAPFKWTGKNANLKRQCGPRLAVFFTRVEPFTPQELEAVDGYIRTIPRPPNRHRPHGADLTAAQRRGKKLFQRTRANDGRVIPENGRCVTCHFPPLYTNRTLTDVGTKMELDRTGIFDVPHLTNVYSTAPYLHNGISETLEEIWTRYNPEDKHGVTNDLTKDQLNDLIEYLKTL